MSTRRRTSRGPQLSDPTVVDPAGAFDVTDLSVVRPSAEVYAQRQTLLSDPPTVLVRGESFRELPPGTVVGEIYEIDARLGAGAMGEVYAARHVKLGKRVAIKVIDRKLSEDDAAIERFAMEARTLAQIQHPAIVAVDHVGELADGRAYFVMELLRGEPLFDRLRRGRLPLPEALRILDQMARGLEAAHAEGVTHRDLKPENTFLVHLPGEPPAVKLLDFGLAKLRSVDDFRAERTQSGVAIGTPMYMSPEQARGPDVDHRTDVYALGCVAYELVLGKVPFPHARTAPELYAAHLAESPPLPRSIWPEIPPQLDLALFAMLAKDPSYRPTLAQFRAVLAAVRDDDQQRAATEFVGPRIAPAAGRLRIAAAVIGVVGALIIGIAIGTRSVPPGTLPSAPASILLVTPIDAAEPVAEPVQQAAEPAVEAPKDPPSRAPARDVRRTQPSVLKTPKASSAAPIDAGVDRGEDAPPPTPDPERAPVKAKPRVDRNQTIDPFAKKKGSKVNP